MAIKLYDVFVDCAICGINAPGHITYEQYFEKYKNIGRSDISINQTQSFLNALYSFKFPRIEPGLDANRLNIVSQLIIHLYLISSHLKEWMADAIFANYSFSNELTLLSNILRMRDVMVHKIRQSPEYLVVALTYLRAELSNTKCSKHIDKIPLMFESKELVSIMNCHQMMMLKTKRLNRFRCQYYKFKHEPSSENLDDIHGEPPKVLKDKEGMMDFIEFEFLTSLLHLKELKESPIQYQISRYQENDYSLEDPYEYMRVLDNTIRMNHENARSVLMENLVMAQTKPDYPNDLRERLAENFKKVPNTIDILPLFNHVMRKR